VRRGLIAGTLIALVAGVLTVGVVMWPRDDVVSGPAAVVVLGGAGAKSTELGRDLAGGHDAPPWLAHSA